MNDIVERLRAEAKFANVALNFDNLDPEQYAAMCTAAADEITLLRQQLASARDAAVVAERATNELVRDAYELAAQVAERDVDWTAFGKRDIEQWDGGADALRDYRLGIVAGRSIAASIRSLKSGQEGKR